MEVNAHQAAEPADAGVTTGFLARKLGVSPMTLRSWDRRYGLGPAVRADGRHRRWSPDDVRMMQEMCRLTTAGVPPAEAARTAKRHARAHGTPAADPLGPSPVATDGRAVTASARTPPPEDEALDGEPLAGDARRECRGLASAAVRLDGAAVQRHLTGAVRAHGLAMAWEEVMMPALHAVGRKWQASDDRHVEVEHLLSWHVSATLRHAYVTAAAAREALQDVSPVLLGCLPGEPHTLPIEALGAALAEQGAAALMLGGDVPAEAFLAAVHRVSPLAVVLWSQSRSTASLPLARHIAAERWGVQGARTHTTVLLCGPGWDRRTEPGLLRPYGLRDAVRMIGSLAAERPN
ncbi:MerR family transcriptional regulator [Streptomyces siamensis]|uniref:MerR family transcriptional regulator n=1 Tax=Streptomyces siamensis TaxID=1274986 RepID=A0ABP9JHE6_9ACTN